MKKIISFIIITFLSVSCENLSEEGKKRFKKQNESTSEGGGGGGGGY